MVEKPSVPDDFVIGAPVEDIPQPQDFPGVAGEVFIGEPEMGHGINGSIYQPSGKALGWD